MAVADPFERLGVSRDAGLEEIRAAYRQAALACHPDTNPGDADEAARRFYEVTEAYRACLRWYRHHERPARKQPEPRATPQDYALQDAAWLAASMGYAYSYTTHRFSRASKYGWRKETRARLDETRLFICLWPVSILFSLAVSLLAVRLAGPEFQGPGSIALAAGVYCLAYVGSLALIIAGVTLTREVVVLALQILGYCSRRALPGRVRRADLPRQPRWRIARGARPGARRRRAAR
jgi:hypothetical protein